MERADAERVFALVADIGGDIRGRIVSERWWLIWIVLGIQVLLTNTITQLLLWSGENRPVVYFVLWGVHTALMPLIIFFIHRRSGGQRSASETYLWWIWVSFVLCALSIGALNQLAGLPLFFDAPVLGLLAAFAFSIMAMVTHRFFLLCTAVFLGVMLAMSFFPHVQFLIYGMTWFILLGAIGIYYRMSIVPHSARLL